MTTGQIKLSLPQIQGHIRQLLETKGDLTPEERYSLTSAVEIVGFMNRLSPGLQKAMSEHRSTRIPVVPPKPTNGTKRSPGNGDRNHIQAARAL